MRQNILWSLGIFVALALTGCGQAELSSFNVAGRARG